jgi:hypothetical protein
MEASEPPDPSPFRYHLELTPPQLKITHTALRSLLDDFGHDEQDVVAIIHEVLEKLPDEHAIRAIQLDREVEEKLSEAVEEPTTLATDDSGDEPEPAA